MTSSSQKSLAVAAGLGTVALAAASYFGLTLLAGGKKVEKKAEGVNAETVFAQDTSSAPAEASANAVETDPTAVASETPAAEPSADAASTDVAADSSTPAADASADPVAAAADAAASAVASGSGPLTAEDAQRIGEEVARQVAAQVAQQIVNEQLSKSGGGGSGGGLTADEARKIGEEEGRRVAEEVARSVVAANPSAGGGSSLTAEQAEQIGLAAGRRAARQVAAKTARDVVRKEFGGTVTASAAPASEPAAAPAETPAEQPTETAAAEPAKPRPAPSGGGRIPGSPEAGADALKAWWPATSSGEFGLVYAGQPKGEEAIALLFSNAPNASALGSAVKVYDAQGNVVSGSWEPAAANPRLVVFRSVKPGRYTVVVEPSLADSSGKAIAQPSHGPVYVTT